MTIVDTIVDEKNIDKIVEIKQRGFKFFDRLIEPAKVIVAVKEKK